MSLWFYDRILWQQLPSVYSHQTLELLVQSNINNCLTLMKGFMWKSDKRGLAAAGPKQANIYSFHPLIAIDGSKDLSLYYNSYPKQFNPSCQTDTHKLPAGIGIKTFICFSELSEYFLSITKQKGNQDNSAVRTRTWRILHRSPTECFGKILWCFTTTFVRNLEEEHSYLIEDFFSYI